MTNHPNRSDRRRGVEPISNAKLDRVLEAVDAERAEIFVKQGRSRSCRRLGDGTLAFGRREEAGWAVRAGDDARSLFYAASGSPDPDTLWPRTTGGGLILPTRRQLRPERDEPAWTEPPWLDLPFASESEIRALFTAIDRSLQAERPGARIRRIWLDDGASREILRSTEGASSQRRRRLAMLRLEAVADGRETSLDVTAPGAGRFDPSPLARRLADRLALDAGGQAPDRDRGEILLAPAVMVPLLVALRPLWLGSGAAARAEAAADRRGRLAARAVTLIDDPRLPSGLLAAAVDGEGVPTQRRVLIDRGNYLQSLVDWRAAGTKGPAPGDAGSDASTGDVPRSTAAGGTIGRSSWRQPPALGVSHLHLASDPSRSPASLLTSLRRGYYLVTTGGSARLDANGERFALPVKGWALRSGRATAPIGRAWLTGNVTTLLQGVLATARDLTFYPALGGMVGSPTVSTRGLELRGAAPP